MEKFYTTREKFISIALTVFITIMLTLTDKVLSQITVTVTNIDSVLCFGDSTGSITVSALGGTPPYTYLWNTTPPQAAAAASNLPAGTYTVTVNDNGGNSASQSATVSQPSEMTFSIDVPDSVLLCNGLCNGSYNWNVAGGTSPWNINLSNGVNGQLCAGTYYVTVVDGNGCTKTDSFNIYDSPYPPLQVHIDSVNVTCYNECSGQATSVATGGVPPYSYEWYDQNGSMSFSGTVLTNLCPGYYSLKVTDSVRCSATDTTFVGEGINIDPSIAATPISGEVPIIIHFSYTGTNLPGNSYTWIFGDGHYSTAMNPLHLYTEADTFTVWVNVYNGDCNDYTNIQVYTYKPSALPGECEGTTDPISFFPNPVTDILNIETTIPINEIKITNISGRILYYTSSRIIDCSSFAEGVYYILIDTEKGTAVKKFIKE